MRERARRLPVALRASRKEVPDANMGSPARAPVAFLDPRNCARRTNGGARGNFAWGASFAPIGSGRQARRHRLKDLTGGVQAIVISCHRAKITRARGNLPP